MILTVTNTQLLDAHFIETCKRFLPQSRVLKMEKYLRMEDKINCAVGYLLVLKALKMRGVWKMPELKSGTNALPEWSEAPNGKPWLPDYPGWHFNISHCKKMVACALDTIEIGMDVECAFYDKDVAQFCCNDRELEKIQSAQDKEMEFCKIWTRKEALLKLAGEGIRDNLKSVDSDSQTAQILTKWYPDLRVCLSYAQKAFAP